MSPLGPIMAGIAYVIDIIIDAFNPWKTPFHVALIAAVLSKIIRDISTFLHAIIPVYNKGPITRYSQLLASKRKIIESLPGISRALAEDETCALCKDQHVEPLELPCQHVYCKACLETLMDHGYNYCGLCKRQCYSLEDLPPTDLARRKASKAQRVLYSHLISCGLAATGLLVFVSLWPNILAALAAAGGSGLAYELLCVFAAFYFYQVCVLKIETGRIDNLDEEWGQNILLRNGFALIWFVWTCLVLAMFCNVLKWMLIVWYLGA
ncbi:hypothetical protein CLAFUW4_12900 [Fulvia fulva]|uniref:RING-type domain-containing protein n=1 Tax=Passalora fulva TaxID=5499 RepID=A0A9Q8UVE0_PASFU|nr:uncharacterized protein CLAFUR5_12766 [Fulvia fulva]KAK4611723.1 hypothetical protein CLAFUR4_12904 [Fulvia fulva]UJO23876.1 hypothetical protein CLAFUR5_12766 [Fulvia fulva]WPV21464.1 hypothetical protein CLAFUW4_12900 [Fulvia fulva]WPV35787.1 hypothetical protein CLAFUW7_12907 [Fulvia fulva]